MRNLWIDIGSDVNWIDYGGVWARQVDATRWFVLQFANCADWGDTGYDVELSEVDTEADPQTLARACDCVGLDQDDATPLELVAAMHSDGAKAPLYSQAGTNAHQLVRAARREARVLIADSDVYRARMDRPVNAIGSTAREYQAGDIRSAVLRGVSEGDPRAEIMLRMGV